MTDYKTIAGSRNFIVLDRYTKELQVDEGYQSEGDLEREFIRDLVNQGYEAPLGLNTPQALFANVRAQPETLNNVQFSEAEWQRFVETCRAPRLRQRHDRVDRHSPGPGVDQRMGVAGERLAPRHHPVG